MKYKNYSFKLFFIATLILILLGCSKETKYDSKEAIKKGDIVYQSKVSNFDRFEEFLNNIKNKKEDKIRVTAYTKEGNPIFHDLNFNKKEIQYEYDASDDDSDEDLKFEDVCKEIKKDEKENEIEYYISNCSQKDKYYLFSTEK